MSESIDVSKPEQALATCEEILKQTSDLEKKKFFINLKASILDKGLNQTEKAIDFLKNCLEEIPKPFSLYKHLGDILARISHITEDKNYAKLAELAQTETIFSNKRGGDYRLEKACEALNFFQKALTIKPDSISVIRRKGDLHYSLDQPQKALLCYNKLNSGGFTVNYSLGIMHYELGEHQEALNHLKIVLNKKENAEVNAHYGRVLVALGQQNKNPDFYKKAMGYFDKAIALAPEGGLGYYWKGTNLLLQFNQPAKSIEYFDKALDLNNGFVRSFGYYHKALAYLELGQKEMAIECYDEAIKCSPRAIGLYVNQIKIFKALNKPLEALYRVVQAMELDPKSETLNHLKNSIIKKLKDHFALQPDKLSSLEEYMQIDENQAWDHYIKGKILYEINYLEDSLLAYNKALDLSPKLAKCLLGRAKVHWQLGKKEEALNDYKEYLEVNSLNSQVYPEIITLLKELGREEEARPYYELALKYSPPEEKAIFYKDWAHSLQAENKFNEALCCYEKVLEIHPRNFHAHHQRNKLLKLLEQNAEQNSLNKIENAPAAEFGNEGAIKEELTFSGKTSFDNKEVNLEG